MSAPYILTWLDAQGFAPNEAIHIDDLDHYHQPVIMETVGWVLRDDDLGVTIASENQGEGEWRGVTFVPRGIIVSLKKASRPSKVTKIGTKKKG